MPEKTREEIKPMRTRPFNLKGALAGKPVVTRYFEEVTNLTEFTVKEAESLVGVNNGVVKKWFSNGQFIRGVAGHRLDLFMLVTPHKELPEGVEMPKGYRLLESGERFPIGALGYEDGNNRLFVINNAVLGQHPHESTCVIVPDYSTGLWKEVTE